MKISKFLYRREIFFNNKVVIYFDNDRLCLDFIYRER